MCYSLSARPLLLQLRHPNVLAYKDSTELQEKGQTVLYLVTQPVKPLKLVLDELNLSGQQRYVNTQAFAAATGAASCLLLSGTLQT